MKLLFAIFGILLLLGTPAMAQDYWEGFEAHKRGDYAAALNEWRPLAEEGDVHAQFSLGPLCQDRCRLL